MTTSGEVMKAVLVLGGLLAASVMGRPADKTELDKVDLIDALSNSRLYQKYFKCFTDAGRCTSDAIILKGILQDALSNGCAECSEIQKNVLQKIYKFMVDKKPDDLDVLMKIYDPDGNYRKKFIKLHKENK